MREAIKNRKTYLTQKMQKLESFHYPFMAVPQNFMEDTVLSVFYANKIFEELLELETEDCHKLFSMAFKACSLPETLKDNFIIDLETVYKWLGYYKKANAKRVLAKHGKIDVDYTVSEVKQTGERGCGRLKEQILLTVPFFKLFCLVANTSKSTIIKSYYIYLEDMMRNYVQRYRQTYPNEVALLEDRVKHDPHLQAHVTVVKSNFDEQDITTNEKIVQLRLARETNGAMEVPCAAGRVDLLTTTEIIEIKVLRNWKHAIGQVLAYSDYFPEHTPRIHLIVPDEKDVQLQLVIRACEKRNIKVTWELEDTEIESSA